MPTTCPDCGALFYTSGWSPCVCLLPEARGHRYFFCRQCTSFVYEPPCTRADTTFNGSAYG